MQELNRQNTNTTEKWESKTRDNSPDNRSFTYPERASVAQSTTESAKIPNNISETRKTAIISQRAAIIVAISLVVITFSIRDLVFFIIGLTLCGGFILYTQAIKLEEKNARTRIMIHFKDLKRDFDRLLQKADMVHVNRNYFINNYSKGLYHQLAFEEQLDIVKWVEEVETKLQAESLKQFREFEQNITDPIEDVKAETQSSTYVRPLPDTNKELGAQSSKITIELSLRDVTEQLNKIDSVNIKSLDEKHFKILVGDIKTVLNDIFKTNEEIYSLWGSPNGYTFDRLKRIFHSSPVPNSPQYNMFGLNLDTISNETPDLFQLSPMIQFIAKSGASVNTRMMFDYEWDLIKDKFVAGKNILSEKNQHAQKEIEEAVAKNQEELAAKVGRTAVNIKKLKEYFNTAKQKLSAIQQEFNSKMTAAKTKIEDFKKNFDNRQEYEIQLKLEYEIRLDISKLYSLKHSHESECAGLERRLRELEIFNTNTELLYKLFDSHILRFIQNSEDKVLNLVKGVAATRMCELLTIDENFFKVDDEADSTIKNIYEMYSIKVSSPLTDEDFKYFLSTCLVAENLDTVRGRSTTKEITAIQQYVDKVKGEIQKVKDDFRDLQLDANNEFDEGIVIGKVPEGRITLRSINSIGDINHNSVLDHSSNSDGSVKSNADWTTNKLKAHKLQELLDKNIKSMEAIYEVFQQEFKLISASESRIEKILSTYKDENLKNLLFRRIVRSYFGKRLCLQDLVQKLHTLLQLTAGLKWEVDWLLRTVYTDAKNEKLMSQNIKKTIFQYLQIIKSSEVSAKAMIIESICTHQFREYQITQLLLSDKYVPSDTIMIEDVLEQQKLIRRGTTNQLFSDDTAESAPGSKRGIETTPRKFFGYTATSNRKLIEASPRREGRLSRNQTLQSMSPRRSPE